METVPRKRSNTFKKVLGWLLAIGIIVLVVAFWWKYYFVFGEGVKSGELNYLVKKGNFIPGFECYLVAVHFI